MYVLAVAYGGQKREPNSLELELQPLDLGPRNQSRSVEK